MTQEKLQEILQSKKQITIEEVLQTIYELKQDASREKTTSNSDREYYFYDGEVNAFCICLDLLEKYARK